MSAYNKFWVAIAGAVASLVVSLGSQFGLDLSANTQVIADLIIAGLTAIGVYVVANKEAA